ncbi:sigma-B regulation protein RsbU (phosphoserine phosphatase) [Motilibacter peucedani]|uniref:Sigma-B regulation protein RsbU (Phosphoserine phosphatase) n=1 Tax=Motilibacter peucedani TaxID=598650 RepID=A0A420XP24_9ACTN|nr:SpoIIE family protein phosphatase [Motilibacter peucedani]RKS73934.1 sigma-B regulation protein RsbU (phosphoserine phosphatase) [Motilibacter peucedani]
MPEGLAVVLDTVGELDDLAPCGYLTTRPDGTLLSVNSTFASLTGYARGELVGRKRFTDLLTGGGRIFHETHYAPLLQMSGSAREIALDLVRADGTRVPVLVNSVLERDAAGAPVVVRTAVFDATERRSYERELLAAKQRAEESEARARQLARTLQTTLIPPAPPHVPGLDIAAAYRPAGSGEEVGGDFYDVFELSAGSWVVVVGDVCGKGVEAAVVTSLARHTVRAASVGRPEPSQTLHLLNEVLLRTGDERFCTVAVLRLTQDDEGWSVAVSSGGHPLPLLLSPGEEPRRVGKPGSLVGVLPDPRFRDVELRLRPGQALVVHTDGVTEGRRGAEFYGEDRLDAALLRFAGSADSLVHGLLDDVLLFQQGNARDDIAVVALSVPPAG